MKGSKNTGKRSGRDAARAANTVRRKKRNAGRLRLHRFAIIILLLSLGGILSLTVFFKIEVINVAGTDKYEPDEVAAVSGIEIGSNLFRIDKESITKNIMEKFSYIESVEVNRRLPSSVELHVTQSVPAGAVKEGENYVLITREGKVLERGIMYIPEDVPLITGLDTAGVEPGHYIGEWEKTPKPEDETEEQKKLREKADATKSERAQRIKESLVMITYLFEAMEESGFSKITNVDVSDRLNMRIMYENRLLLELGSEADMPYKLELLEFIIHEKLEPEARGILFAANARDKKVVFRPAEDYTAEYEERIMEVGDDEIGESQGKEDANSSKNEKNAL